MIRSLLKSLALASMVVFASLPLSVAAQSPIDGALSHRVLPGWQQADGSYVAGLEITLAPGWKTYWRSPGDAGIPPIFDWNRGRNLENVHIHWPTPDVFWQSGMRSIGYAQRVVLPVTVVPEREGRETLLRGRMDLGICSDICVPTSLNIDAVLPPAQTQRDPAIVAALAAVPYSADEAGVREARCALSPTEDGMRISVRINMPSAGGPEEAVIEPPEPGIWVSEAETRREGNTLFVQAEMVGPNYAPMVVNRSQVRVTVIGQRHAVDIQGCTG